MKLLCSRMSSENSCLQEFSNAPCGGMRMATQAGKRLSCLEKACHQAFSRTDWRSKTDDTFSIQIP
jgi:hypothetical protein